MLRAGLRILLLAVSAAWIVACSQSDEGNEQQEAQAEKPAAPECELVMGWDPWEPYQFIDSTGKVAGLDIEIARAVAAEADCDLELQQGSWADLLKGIQDGRINLVAGATRTPAREGSAWFTTPYRSESFAVYVRPDDLDACAASDSLRSFLEEGKTVGTVADYYYGGIVTELQEDPEVSELIIDSPVSELNYSKLRNRQIDAFIEDPFVATSKIRAGGLDSVIAECPLEVHSGDVSFMLSRAGVDEATFRRFEESLQSLQAKGAVKGMLKRYRELDSD